ncbi:MAG: 3-oxoacyl-[acyl-carrier protein] reductase [Acidobacteriota bacterium]|nr:3-oxoacyl-[acyl-carrier protein] reductase [Acidobacteriota bacterium]
MDKQILITGASGLLGKALVKQFSANGYHVFAQYHQDEPHYQKNCDWVQADFSTLTGIRDFLVENSLRFKRCGFLVNNYGPITYKDIADLTAEDFYFDFHHNVITAFEITNFFIKYTQVQAVVNIGFEDVGLVKSYKKILTYAAAKNALQLMTESFAARYESIGFHLVSPATMEGAKIKSKDGKQVSPQSVALEVFEKITINSRP